MSEATTKNVGKFITGTEYRDAIHIAVAPVLCSENLCAAAPVKMVAPNVVAFCEGPESIGIIDPYITVPVPKGTWVYVFMYMNTITDLHHEWNHPAFEEKKKVAVDAKKALYGKISWSKAAEDVFKTTAYFEGIAPLEPGKIIKIPNPIEAATPTSDPSIDAKWNDTVYLDEDDECKNCW